MASYVSRLLLGRSGRIDARNPMSGARALMEAKMDQSVTLYKKDLRAHYGCVNAIEFSNGGGEWITSGGDDRRVLLWNVEKALGDCGSPVAMKGEHNSNIFCLAFDNANQKIFSGGNDEQVVIHDANTRQTINVFLHDDAIYGLSVDPNNDNVFVSACDDGRVLVYDIRVQPDTEPFVLARSGSAMHAVMYNPAEPRLLATANSKEGIALWDIREPEKRLIHYGTESCMSVRFNELGDQLLALQRRRPPVVYRINSTSPIAEFHNPGYYNSCTMKSCSFGGTKDQYVLSGSDDFGLYVWKIPEEASSGNEVTVSRAHMVLRGHRSIVNQVRFNKSNSLVLSSGVEKVIKVWSPFGLPHSDNDPNSGRMLQRLGFSYDALTAMMLHTGNGMSHDYTDRSMDEDPGMLKFFDTLVQRELEDSSNEGTPEPFDDMTTNSAAEFTGLSDSDDDEGDQDKYRRLASSSAMLESSALEQRAERLRSAWRRFIRTADSSAAVRRQTLFIVGEPDEDDDSLSLSSSTTSLSSDTSSDDYQALAFLGSPLSSGTGVCDTGGMLQNKTTSLEAESTNSKEAQECRESLNRLKRLRDAVNSKSLSPPTRRRHLSSADSFSNSNDGLANGSNSNVHAERTEFTEISSTHRQNGNTDNVANAELSCVVLNNGSNPLAPLDVNSTGSVLSDVHCTLSGKNGNFVDKTPPTELPANGLNGSTDRTLGSGATSQFHSVKRTSRRYRRRTDVQKTDSSSSDDETD